MTARTSPRILMIQTQAENAGAQEIARLLAGGLGARGYEVHQLFFYRRTGGFDAVPNTRFCALDRPGTPLAFGRFLWRLLSEIRRVKPDVVLTFQHYGNFFGTPFARLAGVPVIVANQNSAPEMMNRVVRLVDRWSGSYGLYDANVTNSHDTEREFANHPAAYRRRLVHIPHGFQNKTSTLSEGAARAQFGLPQGVPLLGTVARLNPLKQIDAAIRILPKLPGVHLASAGQGPDRERLLGVAAEVGVADRYHLVGEVEAERVGEFLAALNIFLFPSRSETFGLAGVEAAQTGLPVVANDLPVLREVLETEGEPCALFVDANDTEAFAATVGRVLADPVLAGNLSRAGKRLEQRYSLDAMVDGYVKVIEGLRTGPSPRPATDVRTA